MALEQDETRLADTANNIEEGLIECGSQWLRLLKQFVKMPRLVRVAGKDNVVDVLDWAASDLKPEDVIMDSFSALSESPAQRRQMVFDLLGMGLFHNPDTGAIDRPTRTRIMEMLQFLDWEGVDDDDQLHSSKAERENRQLAAGALIPPVYYDSHLLHIKRHYEFRLSTEYEALIAEQPMIVEAFNAHLMLHFEPCPNDAGARTGSRSSSQKAGNRPTKNKRIGHEGEICPLFLWPREGASGQDSFNLLNKCENRKAAKEEKQCLSSTYSYSRRTLRRQPQSSKGKQKALSK